MLDTKSKALDLIFGRWRSQILYTAVKLGIVDAFISGAQSASITAAQLNLDPYLTYRLLRALSTLELLHESEKQTFSLTELGKLFTSSHPETLCGVTLLEEGPEHYALWKHLPDMIRDGKQNAFLREFGKMAFDHAAQNHNYADVFNDAMISYSGTQSAWTLEALETCDFSTANTICDIGGGYGHLLCSFLTKYTHLKGMVLELSEVTENKSHLLAKPLHVENRCSYISGDMFVEIPPADVYIMKMILHDWNDDECVHILNNALLSASSDSRIYIVEHVIPAPGTPHFSKLFDIHMMCWGTGRERTEEEYAALLERAGWMYVKTWYPQSRMMGAVEGLKK